MSSSTLMLALTLLAHNVLSCPNDWVRFDNSCYVFLDETDVTWTAAKSMCETIGGRLIEIGSSAEKDFLASMALARRVNFWIGLNDFVREGRWVLVSTNDPTPFLIWDSGVPDNSHRYENGQDCVLLKSNGKFDDHWCELGLSGYNVGVACEAPVSA